MGLGNKTNINLKLFIMKFQVKQGIFENTIFEGKIINDRVYNLETEGQSYPVANCELYELFIGSEVCGLVVIDKISCIVGNRFFYGLRRLDKKGNLIKGGKGAGGTKTAQELTEFLYNTK